MIHVNRSQITAPEILTGENTEGSKEKKKAIEYYDVTPPPEKAFKFKVYKNKQVGQALTNLFHGKCAYCESRYAGTQPMDVEHWRPKGEIHTDDGKKLKPGYYWLAADWSNLLPSCIDCNRRRTQKVGGENRTVGKANQFPLKDESQRARKEGEEFNEIPLLLNPCNDDYDPRDHLEFVEEAVVRAKLDSSGKYSEMGTKSIEVYALSRSELVQDRNAILLLITHRIHTIKQLGLIIQKSLSDEVRYITEDLMSHEIAELSRFKNVDQPFALLARQIIDSFISQLTE